MTPRNAKNIVAALTISAADVDIADVAFWGDGVDIATPNEKTYLRMKDLRVRFDEIVQSRNALLFDLGEWRLIQTNPTDDEWRQKMAGGNIMLNVTSILEIAESEKPERMKFEDLKHELKRELLKPPRRRRSDEMRLHGPRDNDRFR